MTDTPDWLTVGATVAEYSVNGRRSARTSPTFAVVERLTPTLAVLDNGNRYRLADRIRVGERRTEWGGHTELRSVAEVRDTLAWQTAVNLRSQVASLLAGPVGAEKVLETLDRIEELVSAARAQITASVPPEESKDV